MPENKTRKKYPGNFLRKNIREKIRRKKSGLYNPENLAGNFKAKIKPEKKSRKYIAEKSRRK